MVEGNKPYKIGRSHSCKPKQRSQPSYRIFLEVIIDRSSNPTRNVPVPAFLAIGGMLTWGTAAKVRAVGSKPLLLLLYV